MDMLTYLRSRGWMVAIHNDYHLEGKFNTFWLLTRDKFCIRGEGTTDEEALAVALDNYRNLQRSFLVE